jgi:hypothetical protein
MHILKLVQKIFPQTARPLALIEGEKMAGVFLSFWPFSFFPFRKLVKVGVKRITPSYYWPSFLEMLAHLKWEDGWPLLSFWLFLQLPWLSSLNKANFSLVRSLALVEGKRQSFLRFWPFLPKTWPNRRRNQFHLSIIDHIFSSRSNIWRVNVAI